TPTTFSSFQTRIIRVSACGATPDVRATRSSRYGSCRCCVSEAHAPDPLLPNGKRNPAAGLALGVFEIVRAEGIRPYLLVGAGLMIGAAGVWLVDEFVRQRRRR